MKPIMDLIGTIAGFTGAVMCIMAVVLRLIGQGSTDFMLLQAINVFIVGIGVMVFGCWAKLQAK